VTSTAGEDLDVSVKAVAVNGVLADAIPVNVVLIAAADLTAAAAAAEPQPEASHAAAFDERVAVVLDAAHPRCG